MQFDSDQTDLVEIYGNPLSHRNSAVGICIIAAFLVPEPSNAFDQIRAWTGYCIYEFQNLPALANASLVFKVPPSVACECIAPRMAAQTTEKTTARGRQPLAA